MVESGLSCVIAAFNAEHMIRSAVSSALRQTRAVLEVIVVDDGSTDATADVVARIEDPRVRLLSQANAGPAAARNAGIAVARGEWIGFLDSDDLWLPTYAERAHAALQEVPRPGFAYTNAYVFHADSGRVRRRLTPARAHLPAAADRESLLLALLRHNFVFSSATVPATVLAAVGGYDERLKGPEDYDLWLRIVLAGFDPSWMGGPLALYRLHARQLSQQGLAMRQAEASVYSGLSERAMPSDATRQLLLERREVTRREVALESGAAGWASRRRRLRHALGRGRERARLGRRLYRRAPLVISEAFGDLRSVDRT